MLSEDLGTTICLGRAQPVTGGRKEVPTDMSTAYQHRNFTLASGDDWKLLATRVRQPTGSYTWKMRAKLAAE
jgi:uncharacterized protein (DUF2237 family)